MSRASPYKMENKGFGGAYVLGVSNEKLSEKLKDQVADFPKVQKLFDAMFIDKPDDPKDTPKRKLEFAIHILYNICAQAQKLTKKNADGVWTIKNEYGAKKNTTDLHVVNKIFVTTYKDYKPPACDKDGPIVGKLVMTIRQALLIATNIICIAAEEMYENKIIVLTPLAGEIFPRTEVPRLALRLKLTEIEVIQTIIASALSSGHHLIYADINCAMACALVATHKMKEEPRRAIVTRIGNQYVNAKRGIFKKQTMIIWLSSATRSLLSSTDCTKPLSLYNKIMKDHSTPWKKEDYSVFETDPNGQIVKDNDDGNPKTKLVHGWTRLNKKGKKMFSKTKPQVLNPVLTFASDDEDEDTN